VGYGILGKGFNKNSDSFYFCRVCKRWNNPFEHKTRFESLKKDNICDECIEKANTKSFYDKE
jgi:hypothetical protein